MFLFVVKESALVTLALSLLYKRATSKVFSRLTSSVAVSVTIVISTVSILTSSVDVWAWAVNPIKRTKIKVAIVFMTCAFIYIKRPKPHPA
ncbi:Putative protein [Zobellia galactanivorans]|uniref:Uncharacterized protein n=1 Tax=Zobellia galactanivorans (strain DSM 12802 / CCUG 47099 / CIP 106680 / NCIMB 13871 / Dsij) TaxID=63186 RepID=G0KZN5_ZOBGA|nr:Putative protein [Zobellia galactanivorans]